VDTYLDLKQFPLLEEAFRASRGPLARVDHLLESALKMCRAAGGDDLLRCQAVEEALHLIVVGLRARRIFHLLKALDHRAHPRFVEAVALAALFALANTLCGRLVLGHGMRYLQGVSGDSALFG
jgi:hypothetical protein